MTLELKHARQRLENLARNKIGDRYRSGLELAAKYSEKIFPPNTIIWDYENIEGLKVVRLEDNTEKDIYICIAKKDSTLPTQSFVEMLTIVMIEGGGMDGENKLKTHYVVQSNTPTNLTFFEGSIFALVFSPKITLTYK